MSVELQHLLICGLGSIGRRHLENFRLLGVERIDAFRTGKATLPDEGRAAPDRIFGALDLALAEGPQAVVVANPTSLHVATATAAVRAGCHVLVEKPLSHARAGCRELLEEARDADRLLVVGCNLRFHALLSALRRIVASAELGKPLLARSHFGAYLPAWHPWEDYRRSYAARRELGGGASLTHIHEIDFLLWLFGPVSGVRGFVSSHRPLGTDVDETSVAILRHRGGVLTTLSLSLCQQPPARRLQVVFESGVADLDFFEHRLTVRDAGGKDMEIVAQEAMEATWAAQARAFEGAIGGGTRESLCTGAEALAALDVAFEILELDSSENASHAR